MLMKIIPPLAAVWYGFGLSQWWIGMSSDPSAAPTLIWAVYALASAAGLVGALMLWARRQATAVFAVSLASAVIYFGWLFTQGSPAPEDGPIAAMVVAVTTGLLVLSTRRPRIPAV